MKRIFSVALWLYPLLFYSAAGQDDFLVDIAREERERKGRVGTEVRTFSNEDLSQLPNARVTMSEVGEGAGESGRSQSRVEERVTASKRLLLDFWKVELRQTGTRLAASVNRLHVLQLKLNRLQNHYLNTPDELQQMRLGAELAKILEEFRKAEAEEVAVREAWQRVQREALRAGLKPAEINDLQPEPPEEVSIFGDL